MNKIYLIFIILAVAGAAVFSGIFTPEKPKTNTPAVATNTACLDDGAPNTGDTVTYPGPLGAKYDLIKSDAHVIEPGKFAEMTNTGQVDQNGHPIYTMGSDYFGEPTDPNLIFVLQNKEAPPTSPFIFKIYLKDGVPIPDYIKKCQSVGGTIKIVEGDTQSFPPQAFNKPEIIGNGSTDPEIAIAYVYSNAPAITFSSVLGLPGRKQVGVLNVPGKGNLPLYFHLGAIYLIDGSDAYEYLSTDNPVDLTSTKKSLQLKKIVFVQTPGYSWFTPACKPAIYLYPEKREEVNVKVNTTGFFTLTIPKYNKDFGWNVIANPNGKVEVDNKIYPYLYYESKIPDSKVKKPEKGYVVTKDGLPQLFNDILPKLGLNNNESQEFKDYWQKALPKSPYYFVGVMDEESINSIEPLSINPNPDSIIRVRLYFEMLNQPVKVQEPDINAPKRNGFTVVEWGGMVKTDSNNQFTCSQ